MTRQFHGERLAALRAELAHRGLDGFIVPRADEHQGEYVPASAERLAWLTGFTGSAGQAVVLRDEAVLFTDGRYTLQAAQQLDPEHFKVRHVTEEPLSAWLLEMLGAGRLGYDPWLHTQGQVERLRRFCEAAGGEARACADNPLDAVWLDRPAPPKAAIVPHPLRFSGQGSAEKRTERGVALVEKRCDLAVLTLPDSIAWLLNVRGGDVPHSPLPLSFALLHADGQVTWFVDPDKTSAELREHAGNGVGFEAPERLGPSLSQLGGKRVLLDPATAPAWVFDRLTEVGAEIEKGPDPCLLAKACKNPVELEGARSAHRRDGVAVSRFLSWLAAAKPGTTELVAAERLARFRQENDLFRDLSFDTISGSGPNGAIVHYRVTEESNRVLGEGELFLVDSGGQYLDGTTDVTRTVALGEPSREMRERFTRVLKGHIALATVRFPAGTSGSQLDSLARFHLWQAGLDFDHGTGHGVGSYLNVHEGPHRISKLPNTVALKPGMIVSNEPGYYKTGAYGIRIENLIAVREDPRDHDERPMLAFETLTLVPIDRRLVDCDLLTRAELAWLDAYHERVRTALIDRLDGMAAEWLNEATKPLARV